eukprot:gene3444-4909_t
MAAKSEPGASTVPEISSAQRETSGDSQRREAAGVTKPSESQPRQMKQRKGQFLIAPRRRPGMQMMGLAPLQFSAVEQALRDSPDIDIIDRIGSKQSVGALGIGLQEGASVLVARMHEDKANALA